MKPRYATFALVMLFCVGLLVFPFVNPCTAEDGKVCTWNAQERGNGKGTSFTNFYGATLYHP